MAEKKSASKKTFKKIIVYIVLLLLITLTVAEGNGYDPIGELKKLFMDTTGKCEDELTVTFIDVGQGDCIFIDSEDCNMLIDCGEASQSEKVIKYLNENEIERLDYVVATHPHSDHMGGMSNIIRAYDVGEIIMPELPDSDIPNTRFFENFIDACSEKNLYITNAERNRIITIGDAEAKLIAPFSKSYDEMNNYSIGILLSHGNNNFLFTGDSEKLAESEMIASGELENVRVYKAGHHGSSTSSSKEFIDIISPEYAVITCGAGNPYGRPHDEIVRRLSEYVKKIYRTDICGNVVFESDGINLRIKTER